MLDLKFLFIRRLLFIFVCVVFCCTTTLFLRSAPAAESTGRTLGDEPASAPSNNSVASERLSEAPEVLPAPHSDSDEQPADGRWRYKFHNGRWWYWLPSERWVVWNGAEWLDYHPTVVLPQSSATWNDRTLGTGFDWSHFSKLDLSDFEKANGSPNSDIAGHVWTRAPLDEPYSPLSKARAMPDTASAVLERSRWSLSVSANDRTLEQSFWPRSFYFYNWGYYSPGYYSPLYRHNYLPSPVGQFNYATSAGGYMGGALTTGMANGFLNRWP